MSVQSAATGSDRPGVAQDRDSLEETFRNSEEHAILVRLAAEQVDANGEVQRLRSYPAPPELEICSDTHTRAAAKSGERPAEASQVEASARRICRLFGPGERVGTENSGEYSGRRMHRGA